MKHIEITRFSERLGVECRPSRFGTPIVSIVRMKPMEDGTWCRMYSITLTVQEARDFTALLAEVAGEDETGKEASAAENAA